MRLGLHKTPDRPALPLCLPLFLNALWHLRDMPRSSITALKETHCQKITRRLAWVSTHMHTATLTVHTHTHNLTASSWVIQINVMLIVSLHCKTHVIWYKLTNRKILAWIFSCSPFELNSFYQSIKVSESTPFLICLCFWLFLGYF